MRLRTLLSGQPRRIIDALDAADIRTDEDLLISASALPELWQRLPVNSMTFSELEQIRQTVIDTLSAPGTSAADLFQELTKETESAWSTSCPQLNTLLRAVHTGVIEVAGDKGSGKTALILNVVLSYLASSKDNAAHWVDTTGDFSAERASRILSSEASGQCEEGEPEHVSSALSRLNVSLAFRPAEAHAVLEGLCLRTSEGSSRIRLIVIDSIAPLFAPYLSSGSSEGQAMMSVFMRTLQDLTTDLGAIALVANNTSKALPGSITSCFTARKLKPALGLTMTFLSDTTLWLEPAKNIFTRISKTGGADDESIQAQTWKEEDLDSVYIAEVLRSRSYVGPIWWSFKIDKNDTLHEFPSSRPT